MRYIPRGWRMWKPPVFALCGKTDRHSFARPSKNSQTSPRTKNHSQSFVSLRHRGSQRGASPEGPSLGAVPGTCPGTPDRRRLELGQLEMLGLGWPFEKTQCLKQVDTCMAKCGFFSEDIQVLSQDRWQKDDTTRSTTYLLSVLSVSAARDGLNASELNIGVNKGHPAGTEP